MNKRNILFGSIIAIIFMFIGIVFSAGFHYANEIDPGAFQDGDYSFNGSLGIGTTNPSYKLHTYSTGISTGAVFESDTTASAIALVDSGTTFRPQLVSSGNDIYIQTNGLERMRLTEIGRVGIGTTSPRQKLDVDGNIILNKNALYSLGLSTEVNELINLEGNFRMNVNSSKRGAAFRIDLRDTATNVLF
jgi:hypothetical protein